MSDDSNPGKRTRASGEVLTYLLREFEHNHNPSSEQRKEISDKTNMSEKAVRIWFQNRRAKLRKSERKGRSAHSGSIDSSRSNSLGPTIDKRRYSMFSINEKYCFIDCTSLSVGSWQRVRSGLFNNQVLDELINLSPFNLNKVMERFDLLVIVSKKNLEINYFFSAMSDNSRILFRIFYPIANILSCSLLDNNIDKQSNELRVTLSHQPKFSVNFYNGVNSSSNQWSICDDFSEGQQVSSAHREGGSFIPHVLVGSKDSISFLNDFIFEKNQQHQANYMINESVAPPNSQIAYETFNPPLDKEDKEVQDFNDDFQFTSAQVGPIWNESNELKANGLSPLGQFGNPSDPSPETDLQHNFHHNEIFSANTPDFVTASQTPNIMHNLTGTTPIESDHDMDHGSTPNSGHVPLKSDNQQFDGSGIQPLVTSPYIGPDENYDAIQPDDAFDFPVVNEYSGLDHSKGNSPENLERFIDYNTYT